MNAFLKDVSGAFLPASYYSHRILSNIQEQGSASIIYLVSIFIKALRKLFHINKHM